MKLFLDKVFHLANININIGYRDCAMARLPRISPPGIPQHIIQRGNNRQVCFVSGQDRAFYASLLIEYSNRFSVAIHAWVFMTNHVHLLASPCTTDGISDMMQAVGRRYVRYFNREYRRSGTLWEGRFKSCLVQSERYLLQCQRYIELNPVRAGMVSDPADYVWSSYRCHAFGQAVKMFTPHQEYLRPGDTRPARQKAYRAMFRFDVDAEQIKDIRLAVNKGLALGTDRFKDEIEQLYGRRVRPARMGRPGLRSKSN
jgi:putative transposase